jgi:hypothetical protein
MDLATKSDADLDQLVSNHENTLGGRDRPLYGELLEERGRRSDARQHLKLEPSIELLKEAAIAQRCTTYGAIAAASGVPWSKARQKMNGPGGHLDRLLDLCRARGLPLLTAICVNQNGLGSGDLGEEALKGFAAGAERLGLRIDDPLTFHRNCREACWAWGRKIGSLRNNSDKSAC